MCGENMKYAIIENSKVVNLVVSDADYAAQQQWVAATDKVEIGWDYVDGQFVDNRPVPEIVPVIPPTKEQLLAQLQAIQQQIESL